MAQGRMPQIEAMYRDHAAGLLRYLERNFGWCSSAEDLLQETFLRWMSQDRRSQAAESPRAFLFGIARNVGLTALRNGKRVQIETLGEVAAKPVVDDDADLARMRTAITKLPEQIRETLELRLRDELSYEEIAMVLEIPIGTVRSRLHTALRMLREEMTQ